MVDILSYMVGFDLALTVSPFLREDDDGSGLLHVTMHEYFGVVTIQISHGNSRAFAVSPEDLIRDPIHG